MADRGKDGDVNEAARRFAETLADSYRVVYGQAAGSAERQQRRAREFSELVSSNLREQQEAGRANARQLSEQAGRQREAGQQLARESVRPTPGSWTTPSPATAPAPSGPRKAPARGRARSRRRPRGCCTAAGAAGAAAGATRGAAEEATFPVAGYDEMNVEEASKRLNDLSAEELRLVRDHEERNKARGTLLEQMDRKIRASQ